MRDTRGTAWLAADRLFVRGRQERGPEAADGASSEGGLLARPGIRPVHRDSLSTLQRGLRVLEYVSQNEGTYPKQVAAGLGLNLGTTYHLVNTLLDEGYLLRTWLGGLVLGEGIATLVGRVDHRPDPYPELHALLAELAERSGGVAVLGRLVGRQAEIVAVADAPGAEHGGHLLPGSRGPTHTMALGKALLSALDTETVMAIMRSWSLPALTERTVTDPERLIDQVEWASRRGFAVDVEEGEEGLCCLSAPIAGPPTRPSGAIAVAVTPDRYRAQGARLAELVVSAARRSSLVLREPGPPFRSI